MSLLIVVILTLILAVANSVFLYLLYKLVLKRLSMVEIKLREYNIDSELQAAFSGGEDSHEEFDKVVQTLFTQINSRYNLRAKSYNEMINILRHTNDAIMNPKLREIVIHFFDKMIVFSYKTDNIPEEDKSELRKELKVIMNMLQK